MPIGEPYKLEMEDSLHRFERNGGAESARQSISRLLQGLLIDSLLGRDLSRWLEFYHQHRDAPPPSHSNLVVPGVYLHRAGAGWLLNQPVEDLVNAGWAAIDAAWSDAKDDEARKIVSSAALGLAHARQDQQEIDYWRGLRQQYPPTDAISDVELLLGAEAVTSPDLMALVAKRWWIGDSDVLAALHAQANVLNRPLAELLAEGRRRIDEDYWPANVEGPPRADFEELSWSVSKGELTTFLWVNGRGGYLHNPAPLLEPILNIAYILEEMFAGRPPDNLKDKRSRAALRRALANPKRPLKVILCIEDSIHNELEIDDADLTPFEQRLNTSVQWMQQRHARFAGGVDLVCI